MGDPAVTVTTTAAAARGPAFDRVGRARNARTGNPPRSTVLGGVVAHVHVNTDDDVDASSSFAADLQALGAKVRKTLCADCTHLVVQNPTTAIRSKYAAVLARKAKASAAGGASTANKAVIPVSVLWVTECKRRGELVEEAGFLVEMTPPAKTSRAKKRKSMEPTKVSEASAGEDRFSSTQQLLVLANNGASGSAKHRSLETPCVAETNEPSSRRRTLLVPPRLILPARPAARPDPAEVVEATHEATRPAAEFAKTPEIVVASPQISATVEKLAAGKARKRKNDPQSRGLSASAVLEEVDGNKHQTAARRRRSDPASKTPEKKSLVMTNVDDATRDVVVSTVRKMGGFKIGSRIQKTTTHVISGSTKRTMSVLKAIARGCWIISPEWVYRSLESEAWKGEAEFELNEAFPACRKSRLLFAKTAETEDGKTGSARGLLSGVKIFVGRTKAPRPEVLELVAFLGGKSVESLSLADFCIGLGIIQSRKVAKEVVQEKWLYDCVSRYELLPRSPYGVSPSKAAASTGDQGGEEEEIEDDNSTGHDDDGESFSGGDAKSDYNCSDRGSGTPNRKCARSDEQRKPGPAAQSPASKTELASTLSPQF